MLSFRAVVNFLNILSTLSFLFQVVAHPMRIPCCRLLNQKEFGAINTVLKRWILTTAIPG